MEIIRFINVSGVICVMHNQKSTYIICVRIQYLRRNMGLLYCSQHCDCAAGQTTEGSLFDSWNRQMFFIFSIHTGSEANAYEEHLMIILQRVCLIADLNTAVLWHRGCKCCTMLRQQRYSCQW